MSMLTQSRPHYVSDGGIRFERLWIFAAAILPSSLACGALLNWLLQQGWYLIVLVPLIAAMLVGVAVAAAVVLSHCRNTIVATLAGGFAGLLMYLSYYYFGLQAELPPGQAHRLDLLPQYIAARLQTDVEQGIAGRRPGNAPKKPRLAGNIFSFLLELTGSIVLAAAVPYLRAKRPYVAELGRWMAREEKRLPPGTLDQFVAAWEAGDLEGYARQSQASLLGRAQAELGRHYASCTLEYVRDPSTSPLEHPIYLTYVDDAGASLAALFRPNRDYRQVQVLPEETIALRSWFPHLDRILTALPFVTSGTTATASTSPAAPSAVAGEAIVTDVPGGGAFRSPAFLIAVNSLSLIPLFTFFGGLAAIVAGLWGFWAGWQLTTSLTCLLLGGLSFAAGAVQGTKYGSAVESWYAGRRLRRMLQSRPEAIVRPDDPEADVIDLTTREHWAAVKLDTLDDIGLLAIDPRRGELKIEADKRRYRIPLAAILECQPECFHHPLDKQMQNQYWHVRLRYTARGEPRELLFSRNFKDWTPRTNENRRARAEDFCRHIEQLRTESRR